MPNKSMDVSAKQLLLVSESILFETSNKTAWRYMDYAAQVKTRHIVSDFTYTEYINLKRKPPKVETKPETGAGFPKTSVFDTPKNSVNDNRFY